MSSNDCTFDKLHEKIEFNCIDEDCIEPDESVFLRGIRDADIQDEKIAESGFLSNWEDKKGKIKRKYMSNKKDACMRKGVSITKLDSNEDEFIEKLLGANKANNKNFSHFCKFRMTKETGRILYTPNDNDKNHHTLYKCDNFSVNTVEIIEVIKIEG